MSFAGTYDLVSSENFDNYLKAAGVGMAKRMLAATMKPRLEISKNGDGTYTIKTASALKNTEITFTPGVEFDEEMADGRMAKSIVTIDGNKLTHIQRIGDESSTIVREFNGPEMKATFTCKGVTSTRVYNKVEQI